MKLVLCSVLVVILTNYISQNPTEGSGNSGVSVKNITRKASNESCQAGGSDCKYFLDLCFSYFPHRDCSIFSLRTLSWVLKPGTSKILHLWTGDLTEKVYNPIRVAFERWENKVVLDVNVSRDDTTDILVDKIQITTRLPSPINDLAKIDTPKHYTSNCSELFCLGVLIYAWCDDIVACKSEFMELQRYNTRWTSRNLGPVSSSPVLPGISSSTKAQSLSPSSPSSTKAQSLSPSSSSSTEAQSLSSSSSSSTKAQSPSPSSSSSTKMSNPPLSLSPATKTFNLVPSISSSTKTLGQASPSPSSKVTENNNVNGSGGVVILWVIIIGIIVLVVVVTLLVYQKLKRRNSNRLVGNAESKVTVIMSNMNTYYA